MVERDYQGIVIVVGDENEVVAISPADAASVIAKAQQQDEKDKAELKAIAEGRTHDRTRPRRRCVAHRPCVGRGRPRNILMASGYFGKCCPEMTFTTCP